MPIVATSGLTSNAGISDFAISLDNTPPLSSIITPASGACFQPGEISLQLMADDGFGPSSLSMTFP